MKKLIYTLGFVLALSSCSSLNNTAYVDDAYYTPGDDPIVEQSNTVETPSSTNQSLYNKDPEMVNPNAQEGYKVAKTQSQESIQDQVYEENPNSNSGNTIVNNYYENDNTGSYAYRFSRFGDVFYPDVSYYGGRMSYSYNLRPRVYLGWNNWSGWNTGISFGSPYYSPFSYGYHSPYYYGYNGWNNGYWPYSSHIFAFSNPYYGGYGYGGYGNNYGYGFGNYGGGGYYGHNHYNNGYYNSGWGGNKDNTGGKDPKKRMKRTTTAGGDAPLRYTTTPYVNQPLGSQSTDDNTSTRTRTSTGTTTSPRGQRQFDYQDYKENQTGTNSGTRRNTGTIEPNRTRSSSGSGTTTRPATSPQRSSTSPGTRTTAPQTRTSTPSTRPSSPQRNNTSPSTRGSSGSQNRSSGTSTRPSSSPSRSSGTSTGGTRSGGSSGSSSTRSKR